MEKINCWYIGLAAFSILAIAAFIVSCSNVQSTPNSTLPPGSAGSTSSPTTNEGLPTILTYKDLNALANSDPAKIDASKLPITPVEDLHAGVKSPPIDMTKYRLTIKGLVNNPLSLSYDDILNYASVSEIVLLICPGAFVDNAEWTGVPVKTILREAGVKPEANDVYFHALDGYEAYLTPNDIQNLDVFLAYKVNGQVLPPEQGYPIRLVVKGISGNVWIKWIDRIELRSD